MILRTKVLTGGINNSNNNHNLLSNGTLVQCDRDENIGLGW